MTSDAHGSLVKKLAQRRGVVMLIGAPDTGKSTLARQLLNAAAPGRRLAYVDADVGQPTVGPPGCVGLRWVEDQLPDLEEADELRFVGSTTPERLIMQVVVATAALVDLGRRHADLVVIDTTGSVSGVIGQTLKYHKAELCRPDSVVALQRGSEMEPIVGMLRRFFSAEIDTLGVDPDLVPVSPEQRADNRRRRLEEAFAGELSTWKVRPTVFAPTLPAGLDLTRLDSMLVGVHDGSGRCLGLGVLEHREDGLRVRTRSDEGMQGLRLGSMRLDLSTFETERVNLREVMFGLEVA